MDGFIHITAIALIIGYAAFSVWFICKRQTVWGTEAVGKSIRMASSEDGILSE